ncbi:MAG: hypothetical protein IKT68_05030, partial [Clostridia bacterium]|nr:hypothetical protein [Clostridia bacterium]
STNSRITTILKLTGLEHRNYQTINPEEIFDLNYETITPTIEKEREKAKAEKEKAKQQAK